MFCDCRALTKVYTPKKSGSIVADFGVPLYESTTDEIFAALPKNATESMVLIAIEE